MKRLGFYGFLGLLLTVMILVSCASGGSGKQDSAGKQAPAGKTGSASASAQGFGGQVKATVTVEKGKITNVSVEAPDETPAIGGRAIEMVTATMVQNNSVEVDATAGASISTKALIQAAKEAYSKIP